MNDQSDPQLLRAYAETRSESAFAELVRRHVDIVYSASRRMVCDPHLAEDVTQGVFLALAKSAGKLTDRSVISGWLHRTAQNIAAQTVRTIERRRAREQEAFAMNELLSPQSEPAWEYIAPHLDGGLGELSEQDRDALMLRYFERKSAQEMAATLGISDEAAQKRVSRAVERLRELLVKRGVTVGAGGLVAAVSMNAVQAAPVGLASSISSTAAITFTTAGITKTIVMTTLQKVIIGAALTAAVGVSVIQTRHASQLRARIEALEQQQEPMNAELRQKQIEHDASTRELAALRDENDRLNKNTGELMRLRGEMWDLRRENAQPEQPGKASISTFAVTKAKDEAAKAAARELGAAVVRGEPGALDRLAELSKAASKSFVTNLAGFNDTERGQLATSTFAPIREAFSVIDEAARNGNQIAIQAVQQAVQIPELAGHAVEVVGKLAGNGDPAAVDMLINYDKYGILPSSSVAGLRGAADAGNQQAIDALVNTTRDEKQKPLWLMAANGLEKSAEAGNATAIDALIGISGSTNINVRNAVARGLRAAAGNQNAKAVEALQAMGLR